jgi:hypothetical protein
LTFPKTLGQRERNSNTVARRIAANIAKLPELLESHDPTREGGNIRDGGLFY